MRDETSRSGMAVGWPTCTEPDARHSVERGQCNEKAIRSLSFVAGGKKVIVIKIIQFKMSYIGKLITDIQQLLTD